MHARTRRTRPLLCSLALSVLFASAAWGGQQTAPELVPADAWAKILWHDALEGDADAVLGLLAALPDEAAEPAVQALKEANSRRLAHLEQAEQRRAERLQEAWDELQEATAKDDLREALRLAVEISTLTQREGGSLDDPRIGQVAEQAERQARKAEEQGDWLTASELFGRLNLLYDTEARYRDDVRRVGRRLQMMRLYTPKRLHDLRSQRLVEAGEDPLPPFNEFGESWQRKLAGVDESMVVRAISYADRQHVEGVKTAQMVVSGLDALKTLATTGDLAEAFPAIGDKAKVGRFLNGLANEQRRFELAGDRADFRDLIRLIGSLRQLNDSTLALPWEALVHEFGNGAMDALDDFSSIVWPDEIRQFQRTTRGSFTGVGIQITIDDADRLVVVTPLDGTPARRAGIQAGDIIRMIDGHSTIGITSSQAVDLITGPAGAKVTLSVEREGVDGLIDFEIVRAEIPLVTVKGWERSGDGEKDWNWWIDRDNRIGYVRLNQFTEDTVRDFDDAVQQMIAQEGAVDGLILDLRYNPGGLLSSAVEIVNRFVREGVVVTQRDAQGRVRERQRARPGKATLLDTPVVVLVNEGSASASEIVSGALQDLDRAVVVGARTFGKGSVQNVYDIGQGLAAMRLTTQYYYLPSGRLIHRKPASKVWGIEPDVHVAMLPEQISRSLRLRQDADIRPEDRGAIPVQNADADDEPLGPPEPRRLIEEGIDPQLETALVLLQSQTLPAKAAHAMLPTTPAAGPAVAGS